MVCVHCRKYVNRLFVNCNITFEEVLGGIAQFGLRTTLLLPYVVFSGKKVAAPKMAPKIRDVPTVFCAKVVRPLHADHTNSLLFFSTCYATRVKLLDIFMRLTELISMA